MAAYPAFIGGSSNDYRGYISVWDRLRFWSKVTKTEGCWIWDASVANEGYGQFHLGGRPRLAHRVAWLLANGIPAKRDGYHGAVIMHSCDNRACVNPAHLAAGSQAQNLLDMHAKGRHNTTVKARGESNGNAKLTEERVREIRATTGSSYSVASRFGVSAGVIQSIRRGTTWRHVA